MNFSATGKFLQYLLVTVVALSFTIITVAQVKFSTVVNERQPGINDYIQVEYTIENAKSVEKIDPPLFKDLRLIQGPMQSNGMTYINGVMSQYKSISFILQPLVKGKILIPGAIAVADGKTMRSQAVTIDVKNDGSAKNNNRSNNNSNSLFPGLSPFPSVEPAVDEEYVLRPGENFADKIKKNLFVKTDVNKTTCYEGEPIMATFKLCSRLKSESRVLKRPSLNGFSVYDMVDPESNRPTVQTIGGRPYNVHLIRQTQLIPLQSGTFVIDPVELDNKVSFLRQTSRQKGSGDRMQQLMEELMNDNVTCEMEEHSFNLSSKPVTITVKPLPAANKPASFNGAVGKFTLQAESKNKTVAAGEQIVLQVTINGAGNLTVINPPSIPLPDGMEAFDPITREKVDKTVYPLSGSKTFVYTFVAKDSGNYQIPPVVFSFFDPAESSYKTLRSDSFDIHVTPNVKKKGNPLFNSLRSSSDGSKWFDVVDVNILIGILTIVLVGILGAFQWKKSRTSKIKESPAIVQAPEVTNEIPAIDTDPLEGARFHLKQANSQEFYNEINRSVWKILAAKIEVPSTELNKFNMITKLQNKGADSGLVFRLQSLLSECEIALYTPMHTTTDMEQTLEKATSIIKDVQTSLT